MRMNLSKKNRNIANFPQNRLKMNLWGEKNNTENAHVLTRGGVIFMEAQLNAQIVWRP